MITLMIKTTTYIIQYIYQLLNNYLNAIALTHFMHDKNHDDLLDKNYQEPVTMSFTEFVNPKEQDNCNQDNIKQDNRKFILTAEILKSHDNHVMTHIKSNLKVGETLYVLNLIRKTLDEYEHQFITKTKEVLDKMLNDG